MSRVFSSNISWPLSKLTSPHTTPSVVATDFSQNELLAITAALLTISFIGTFLNLTVVAAILRSRNRLLDIPSNWFVLSLATADLLVCGVSVPVYIVHLYVYWWEPSLAFCQLTTLISAGSLVLLTYNRFLSIFDPLVYMRKMTSRRARMLTLGMWIVALSLTTVCRTTGYLYNMAYFFYPTIAYYAIINIFTGSFQLYMFAKAWSKIKAIRKQHLSVMSGQQKTAIKEYYSAFRLLPVAATYIVAWIPFIINLASTTDVEERKIRLFQRRFALFYSLLSINSAIDPFIYFLRSDEFKRFTRKIRPLMSIPFSSEQTSDGSAFHTSSSGAAAIPIVIPQL